MKKAMEAVREKKIGWKKAAKTFEVPKTTLMCLSNEKYRNFEEASKTKIGRSTIFSLHLEEQLVKYCLVMEATFLSLTRANLRTCGILTSCTEQHPAPLSGR